MYSRLIKPPEQKSFFLFGPRGTGKTTWVKTVFPQALYLDLLESELFVDLLANPQRLENLIPKGFDNWIIIDEIQRVPELVSYIQEVVDIKNSPGTFILTGSQNFHLLDTVNQSLAGRTALAVLLPFSYSEVYGDKTVPIDRILFTGFYPRIHDKKLNPTEALSFYVSTYLERDLRALVNVKDLSMFEKFLKLCAGRSAQIVNFSNLANDCGINHNTAKSWLSVLEASYVIFFARPHHANFGKRLIKAPKLYFTDVGLAGYLLDIHDKKQIATHPLAGALFENFIVAELLKARLHHGKSSNIYFFRDNVGNEIDVILEDGTTVKPVEIKLGSTINDDFFKGLRYYQKINRKNSDKPVLIYGGREDQRRGEFDIFSYKSAEKVNA